MFLEHNRLPHLHVFILQDGGLLGEDLIGLDTLQALLPLLLLQRKGQLAIYWVSVLTLTITNLLSVTYMHGFNMAFQTCVQGWLAEYSLIFTLLLSHTYVHIHSFDHRDACLGVAQLHLCSSLTLLSLCHSTIKLAFTRFTIMAVVSQQWLSGLNQFDGAAFCWLTWLFSRPRCNV